MELVDLVDKHGRIMMTQIPRREANLYTDLYMCVVLVVVRTPGDLVIVHERAPRLSQAGSIDHVCGAVQSGEAPLEAAARETFEELGVDLVECRLVETFIDARNRFRFIMAGRVNSEAISLIDPHPDEAVWAKPMSEQELWHERDLGTLFVDGFFEELLKTRGRA